MLRIISTSFLPWLGIVGGSISIFSNLQSVIELAGWARYFVERWHAATGTIWKFAFSWLDVELPDAVVPLLNFTLFLAIVIASVRYWSGPPRNVHSSRKIQTLKKWWQLGTVFSLLLIIFSIYSLDRGFPERYANSGIAIGLIGFMALTAHRAWCYRRYDTQEALDWRRSQTADRHYILLVMIALLGIFFAPALMEPRSDDFLAVMKVSLALLTPLSIGVTLIAPSKQLLQRLVFILCGLAILLGLNQLSRAGVDPSIFKAP